MRQAFPSFDQSRNISRSEFRTEVKAEAEPSLPGAAVVQDVSGNHQSFESSVCMVANETQYLVELCTLLVEDVLGAFFAVGQLTLWCQYTQLTSLYAAHLLCARHIWPAGSDSTCSKMSTSSSSNPTRSLRSCTGTTRLLPHLFRSTNLLRSQSPGGL